MRRGSGPEGRAPLCQIAKDSKISERHAVECPSRGGPGPCAP